MTAAVMAICLMAASCGLVFGYHVGVAGKWYIAASSPSCPNAPYMHEFSNGCINHIWTCLLLEYRLLSLFQIKVSFGAKQHK
jgi:hypothetical protein